MARALKKPKNKKLFWGMRRRRRRATSVTAHYLSHKEQARELVLARLHFWNQFYGYRYNRVAIRNQKTCWGSCTSLKNLNFSYKLIFLPTHLQDYVVVHELCHLKALHHGQSFWDLMGRVMPDYEARRQELHTLERTFNTSLRGYVVQ